MRRQVPLLLAGFFMVALIASPCSDKLAYAQDSGETIAATVDIRPNTINLRRNGNFVMGMIKLSEGDSIKNINMESIAVTKINGAPLPSPIAADWAFVDEEFTDSVIAKFPNKIFKEAVKNALPADITYPTKVDISVGGTLTDDVATPFEGTDQVRINKPGKGIGIGEDKNKGGKGGGNGDDGDDDTGEDETAALSTQNGPVSATPIEQLIQISLDIKPGSCPNPIGNGDNNGVVPFAIMGTVSGFDIMGTVENFDVTQIDPASIRITREGVAGEVKPIRWNYGDVATPFEGELCECQELTGDGYMDLSMKAYRNDLVNVLKLKEVAGQTVELTVTGKLKDEFGGTPIMGQDCMRVLKAVLKEKK